MLNLKLFQIIIKIESYQNMTIPSTHWLSPAITQYTRYNEGVMSNVQQ